MLFLALSGALCQRTVIRHGERVSVEEARAMDLGEGDAALAQGRYDEALAAYRRFLSDFPRDRQAAEVMVKTGVAYLGKGDCDTAVMFFDEALSREPRGEIAAHAAWGKARCAYRARDCAEVESLLASQREQARGRLWDEMTMLLARCALESGDKLEAVHYWSEEANQGNFAELSKEARFKIKSLLPELTMEELEALAEQYPDSYPGDLVLIELISRAMEVEDYETAARLCARFETDFVTSPLYLDFLETRKLVAKRVKVKADRIGVLLPLSGRFAAVGEQSLQGVMLAAGIFDPYDPGFGIELVIRDAGREDLPIERVVEELVNDEHVIAIVGPLSRSNSERAADQAQALGVPIIALSPAEDLPDRGPLVYQNCLTKSDQAGALLDYAINELNLRDFGALYPENSYGLDYLRAFTREARRRGIEHIVSVPYDPELQDFRKEIRTLKQARVKAVFFPDSWHKAVMIAPQFRYYLFTGVTLLGTNTWHFPELIRHTQPEDLENAVLTDGIAPEAMRPLFREFQRNFSAKFNRSPGLLEAQAFEAVDLITKLIRRFRIRDREQLKKALDQVERHPGALGVITIAENGKFQKPVYIFAVFDGEFRVIHQSDPWTPPTAP